MSYFCIQVESLLTSEDSGKDLASVQNLMKKHQLVEADIQAHEDRINGMLLITIVITYLGNIKNVLCPVTYKYSHSFTSILMELTMWWLQKYRESQNNSHNEFCLNYSDRKSFKT